MSEAVLVRPKDWVTFHCRLCGNCCRDLEDQLMLEPLDAYRLARHLRDQGEAASIDIMYERYAHPDLLEGLLPIYLVNASGPDHACVFLKDGRCSVYDDRPKTCRMYPFSVNAGQRGKAFEFYQCVDQHSAHYSDGRVLVKDWLSQNFTREDREFTTVEGTVLRDLGCLFRMLDADQIRTRIPQILHYCYYNYDLDQPFMPQYKRNMEALKCLLQKEMGEV